MNDLTVTHHNITWITDHRDRARNPVTAHLSKRRNIQLALFVRTGNHPDSIRCGTTVELRHEVKSMRTLIQIRGIPVRCCILMPCNRRAQAGLFYKNRFIEWREVSAVHGFCHLQ